MIIRPYDVPSTNVTGLGICLSVISLKSSSPITSDSDFCNTETLNRALPSGHRLAAHRHVLFTMCKRAVKCSLCNAACPRLRPRSCTRQIRAILCYAPAVTAQMQGLTTYTAEFGARRTSGDSSFCLEVFVPVLPLVLAPLPPLFVVPPSLAVARERQAKEVTSCGWCA